MRKLGYAFILGIVLTGASYFYFNLLFFDRGGYGFPFPYYFSEDWGLYKFSGTAFAIDVMLWTIFFFAALSIIKKVGTELETAHTHG